MITYSVVLTDEQYQTIISYLEKVKNDSKWKYSGGYACHEDKIRNISFGLSYFESADDRPERYCISLSECNVNLVKFTDKTDMFMWHLTTENPNEIPGQLKKLIKEIFNNTIHKFSANKPIKENVYSKDDYEKMNDLTNNLVKRLEGDYSSRSGFLQKVLGGK